MSNTKINDPFQQREATKYDNPVPSREFILEFLAKENRAISHPELSQLFNLKNDDEVEALRRRLIAMARDHQLQSSADGEYRLLMSDDLFEGRVQGTKEGHGFLLRSTDDDIFLSARQMQNVMDGDLIKVRLSGKTVKGRLDGVVVEILERKNTRIVGRYYRESQTAFVTPENPRLSQDILLEDDLAVLQPKHGQYVLVEVLRYPEHGQAATGIVKQILGDFMAPGLEIDVALHKYDIPHEWPTAVVQQVQQFQNAVTDDDLSYRVDLRKTPFVTIDGEDARDFDDAVFCEKTASGWKLYVAIADVSHYVKKNTALDEEAILRGNSVYFPGRVIPMLPEVLSNGLCSLNPNVDRLAMVAELSLTSRGKLRSYRFYEAVICSHARLTYTKVARMIASERDDQGEELRQRYHTIVHHIDDLSHLYTVLKAARDDRGAMEFETVETRMVFDQEAKIEQIVPVVRNDAHKLIEECMLCANVAAADLLLKANIPALYRIHEGPKEDRLMTLRSYLGILGLELGGGFKPTPDDYALLAQQIHDRPDVRSIQTMMLRSMSQAVYQADNVGHFGLNYPAYTHFTSPIRRYPDLLVHRAIRYLIRGEGSPRLRQVQRVPGSPTLKERKIYGYDEAQMDDLGTRCSLTERRADEATRDVEAWLKCQYVAQHTGEVFEGLVTAVTSFGLFVELKDLYVDGLVHISALGQDYFVHDPDLQAIIGERTAKIYRLGDTLSVSVAKVNLEQRKIDLELVDSRQSRQRRKTVKRDDLSELEMQLAQLPPLPVVALGEAASSQKPSKHRKGAGPNTNETKASKEKSAKKKAKSGKKAKSEKKTTKPKKVAEIKYAAAPDVGKKKKKAKKSNAKARIE